MPLDKNEQRAIERFREMLTEQLGDIINGVVLFGSKARGDDRPKSDIDLLVICNTSDWHVANTVYAIATDVFLETDVSLSTKVLSGRDYRRMKKNSVPFITNIMREGVTV